MGTIILTHPDGVHKTEINIVPSKKIANAYCLQSRSGKTSNLFRKLGKDGKSMSNRLRTDCNPLLSNGPFRSIASLRQSVKWLFYVIVTVSYDPQSNKDHDPWLMNIKLIMGNSVIIGSENLRFRGNPLLFKSFKRNVKIKAHDISYAAKESSYMYKTIEIAEDSYSVVPNIL